MAMGIDISKYQGKVDFNKLKNYCNFVIIRAGYTGYGDGVQHGDPYFLVNMAGAKAAGMPWGAYWFSQAINEDEARAEARYMMGLIKDQKPEYPIYIDTELSGAPGLSGRADRISKEKRTAVVKAFCEEIESAGYFAGFYCSESWWHNNIDGKALSKYTAWIAKWSAKEPNCTYAMWQYSNSGSVPCINGRVDLNKTSVDFPTIIKTKGLNGWPTEDKLGDYIKIHATGSDMKKLLEICRLYKLDYVRTGD